MARRPPASRRVNQFFTKLMTGNNSGALLLTTKLLTSWRSLARERAFTQIAGLCAVRRPPGPHVHPPCDDAGSRFLGRKNEAREERVMPKWAPTVFEDENRPGIVNGYRSAPQWGRRPAPSSRAACEHRPSPACAPVRQNRPGPHAQQEEHTLPAKLRLVLATI